LTAALTVPSSTGSVVTPYVPLRRVRSDFLLVYPAFTDFTSTQP